MLPLIHWTTASRDACVPAIENALDITIFVDCEKKILFVFSGFRCNARLAPEKAFINDFVFHSRVVPIGLAERNIRHTRMRFSSFSS